MKKIMLLLTLVSIFGTAFKAVNELPIGATLPVADVKMKDISGKDITLKGAMKKGGLLVMFSCNTCPYVIKNQQRTVESGNYAMNKNVGVILINSNEAQRGDADSYDAMKAYAKAQGYKWSYVIDERSAVADAFGANKTPECFLFDGTGKLVYHGAIDDNPTDENAVGRKHLKEAIVEMLGGKEVSVKTSKSVGCSIKRI